MYLLYPKICWLYAIAITVLDFKPAIIGKNQVDQNHIGIFNLCVEIKILAYLATEIGFFIITFLHQLINILHFPNPLKYKKYDAEDLLMLIN